MADFNSVHTGAEIDDAVGVAKGTGTGVVVKTGSGAGVKRTIAGTTNQITVSNGDGVSGNPTIALATAVTTSLSNADSAVQPGDLATVATTGAYSDLTGLPTLGTAAATNSTDYATAAQGLLADTAVQPADVSLMVESDVTGVTGADPVFNIISLTQAEYDAIVSPSATTLYVITG